MTLTQEYQQDVQALLALMTPDNQPVVMKAIELVSKYAGMRTSAQPAQAAPAQDVPSGVTRAVAPSTTGTSYDFVNDKDDEEVPAAPTDIFRVERRLIGAEVGDQYVSEKQIRELGLEDGDTVQLVRADAVPGQAPTIRLVAKNKSTATPQINGVQYAVLVRDKSLPADYTLSATNNVSQHPLLTTDDDVPFKFLIRPADVERLQLRPGDIVDLAWYNSEGPQRAVVSWVHGDDDQKLAEVAQKRGAKQSGAGDDSTPKGYTVKIPFDLAGKRVLFVGNAAHSNEMALVVAAHNGGQVTATDATKGSQLKTKVTHSDVMVLITDEVHHVTTNTSVKIAKSQKVPYAVSSSDAPFSIERALYRAVTGMPAYEPTAGAFDYPTVAE
ncbi:DUF2325 domain-containing protein [Lacticaseibacillus thailandensis]|uniref:Uncharacterized protein n=1 Tax=Lacticaseibacillus thailandensis DSM 22698 = JCM 13996 TaxID=1423810 RepID=A0A0R2CIH1_9LACO|nr:DUF2325 domain-containing protein [Lacticaseibacillus thailandensis]KRM87846.1 hypothetical protein FD19_GL000123 [Lacticaseibacillus thailandensis DSM 22698 = JCM 13996]